MNETSHRPAEEKNEHDVKDCRMPTSDPSHDVKNSEHKAKKNAGRVAPCESIAVYPSSHVSYGNQCPAPSPRRCTNVDNQLNTAAMSPSSKPSTAKTSLSAMSQGWNNGGSNRSDSMDGTSAPFKPHTGGDVRWDAMSSASSKDCPLGLTNFRLLKRLGYGDIGSVYLVELRGSNTFFAMKVMDKSSLASRNKLLRAQTEREILGLLDHPFFAYLVHLF